ncbi:hypothetical protein QC761_0063410 [Podospora bellae-mahoneyi]|uniref:Rhodopsin domain-containing protein n=1 Tax=Podospora bellae-mahoneyi TaxID=2093777 RepID=A0ABR0FH30_9PEZI|nr:hypothetical protein QC761_0063410 [Podospora bellae-mahoneyi]
MRAVSASLWGLFEGRYGKEIGEIMAKLAKRPSLDTIRGMENFLMSLFIANTILYLTFYLAKIFILFFYRCIFATPDFRRTCLIIGVSTAYFIAAQVANLCICIPIDLFWHRTKRGGRGLNFNFKLQPSRILGQHPHRHRDPLRLPPSLQALRSLASAVLTKLRDSYGSSIRRRFRGPGSRSKLSDGSGEVVVSYPGNVGLPSYHHHHHYPCYLSGNHPSSNKGSAKELIDNASSSEPERK